MLAIADSALLDDLADPTTTMDLPPIRSRFFVPPLTDKPQNPIIDTLNLISANRKTPRNLQRLPPETSVSTLAPPREKPHNSPSYNLWSDAATRSLGIRSKALSWDRLRPSHPPQATSTGFLSEQDNLVFASARYHLCVRVNDPAVDRVYVTQTKLLNALKLTILGTSSVFHTWDAPTQRFVQADLGDKKSGFLLIDGKDEVISQSLISRFLTIGTLLRRLEVFLDSLRTRSAQEGPVVHAYAHALSTIVVYLRLSLSRSPLFSEEPYNTLSATWMHYEVYEETLVALADLCGLDEERSREDYVPFDPSPTPLLSHLYSHLDVHITRQSPRLAKAIFAFLLTTVSDEYLQQVSRSIGYGADAPKGTIRVHGETTNQYALDDVGGEEKEEDILELLESPNTLWTTFPDFFPPELLAILPAAQKSLVLLQTAQPDHPLLQRTSSQQPIRWFWTPTFIEAAWDGANTPMNDNNMEPPVIGPLVEEAGNEADFALFRLFDLEPGSNLNSSTTTGTHSLQALQAFIDSFPDTLPPIIPTLSHLTSLVLAPLVVHAKTLSCALLSLFLSPSTSPREEDGEPSETNLNFQSHLHLLRSYLLLTSPSFKSKLASALFSDSEDWESEGIDVRHQSHSISMSVRSLRRKAKAKKSGGDGQRTPWAVGLAPSLLERETWPPVGADLSFFLRTVIVDSFDQGRDGGGGGGERTSRVLQEAEYRLGFAIRDLPVGTGKERWLDPLRIEALDFLYMDYRAPRPLEVLITPDILSKYQRMFAFLLRLMRVESALGSLFRMTRTASKPLFATLVQPQKRLLHFRFVARSFVSTLSAYVFDTAIGGNFDPFIARLSIPTLGGAATAATFVLKEDMGFSDVFALAKSHSELLDDVLTACLLRSSQRAVGEVLRQCLELVLEFTIVAGEVYRGRMEEYEAAVAMEGIERRFLVKMGVFIKALKGLVDKGGSSIGGVGSSQKGGEGLRKSTGGMDALYHLYIRLDLGEWWSSSKR